MSNEYKDWLYDKVQEILLDARVIDKFSIITPNSYSYTVEGYKNEEKVKFEVWFSNAEAEWKFERREL